MCFIKNILAIVLLPVTVTVMVPGLHLQSGGIMRIGRTLLFLWWLLPAIIGVGFILIGLLFLVNTINLFITLGKGTLAPWHPTQALVIQGPYRFVHNPMLMGIFGILLGESMLFGSMPIFYWFVIAVILNCVYIPLFDETGLEHRFGEGYVIYKKNVPRWIPRSQPWDGQETKSRSMDKKNT